MGYDGKNEDVVNPRGKHQWCLWMQSMSMLKREENTPPEKDDCLWAVHVSWCCAKPPVH